MRCAASKKKSVLIFVGGITTILLGGYIVLCAWVDSSPKILLGVSAAGMPMGGMTQEQALSVLEENLEQVSNVVLPL